MVSIGEAHWKKSCNPDEFVDRSLKYKKPLSEVVDDVKGAASAVQLILKELGYYQIAFYLQNYRIINKKMFDIKSLWRSYWRLNEMQEDIRYTIAEIPNISKRFGGKVCLEL